VNIASIDCGHSHALCLDYNGNVFSFGSNIYGQLGIGKRRKLLDLFKKQSSMVIEPQKIDIPPCKQVACGDKFSICVLENGDVLSFGNNMQGQLGHGNNIDCSSPKIIPSLKDVDFVECGFDYTLCKTLHNDFYAWGRNDFGQFGLGEKNRNYQNSNTPVECENWPKNIVDIKCGSKHTLVLTSNQEVYSCGMCDLIGRKQYDKYSSSLEKIEELSEIVRIECGYSCSMCIDNYDNLYVFGNNQYGQLGLGDCNERKTPVKHPTLSNIIDISRGGKNTFVKTVANEIYVFGYVKYANLGDVVSGFEKIETPTRVFQDEEEIWSSNIKRKSKAKSARSAQEQ